MNSANSPTSVFAVANWFINKSLETKVPITHMKLQKLVYFAYGWYYAYYDKPLFKEDIQAWQHGPVIADLYEVFRGFGAEPIRTRVMYVSDDGGRPVWTPYVLPSNPAIKKTILDALTCVWDTYSPCSAGQLRNITHRIGSPWHKSWGASGRCVVISSEEIHNYFVELAGRYEEKVKNRV